MASTPWTTPAGSLPISNSIREWRVKQGGLTQQHLADRVAVTRQTIIALEAGKYTPSLLLAFRIAGALGAGIEEIFQYQETPVDTP